MCIGRGISSGLSPVKTQTCMSEYLGTITNKPSMICDQMDRVIQKSIWDYIKVYEITHPRCLGKPVLHLGHL